MASHWDLNASDTEPETDTEEPVPVVTHQHASSKPRQHASSQRVNWTRSSNHRHRAVLRMPPEELITVRKLARRAGVKRASPMALFEAKKVLRKFLEDVVGSAVTYVELARSKTVTTLQIQMALRRRGIILYGFD